MPLYDYQCKSCKNVQEVMHKMTEAPKVKCEKCKKACAKMVSTGIFGTSGGKEIWQYNDVRKSNPKFVKSRDGKTRVRYDGSKHGHGKGTGR